MSNNPNHQNYGYPDGVVAVMDHNKYQTGEVKVVPMETQSAIETRMKPQGFNPIIVQLARLDSSRLPQKLTCHFSGDNLLHRGCQKLTELDHPKIILYPDKDKLIFKTAEQYNIQCDDIKETDNWSELSESIHSALSGRGYNWVIMTNIFCMPFLSMATIYRLLYKVQTHRHPSTTVTYRRNIVWDFNQSDQPVISKDQVQNTAENDSYFECCPLAYWFPTDSLLVGEKELANSVKPVRFNMTPLELIEINTADDFKLAELVDKGMRQ